MTQGFSADFAAIVPMVIDSGLPTSLATFQQPDGVLISPGTPSGVFLDVSGYVGLICMNAPISLGSGIQAGESKSVDEIESTESIRHGWLAGYYPGLALGASSGWRVVITDRLDGNPVNVLTYDFLGAECDSQTRTTHFSCRIVKV